MNVQVKICGVTSRDDALLCAEAGADMIGLNFCRQSSRYISTERAREITAALPSSVRPVGVFADSTTEQIRSIAQETGIKIIQLHGSEPPALCAKLTENFTVIRALRVAPEFLPSAASAYPMCTILLDGYAPSALGGTGAVCDWDIAREVRELALRLILAGGLKESNVAEAIAAVGPDGVDACSSLESAPGIKDSARVEAFVKAAKSL